MHYCSYLSRKQKFECKNGEAITRIESTYDGNERILDRDWNFYCSVITSMEPSCYWTGYVNDPDLQLHARCQENYYIAGIESYAIAELWDRRYNVKCCRTDDVKTIDCSTTDEYINGYRGNINYELYGRIFVGMESIHGNKEE